MPYIKPLTIDKYASDIEDFLTNNSVIPFIGTVPAVLKIAFGAIQTLCAAATLVASTFFLMTQTGRDIWFNSFRHILHGLSNILAGIIQAIPMIGSVAIFLSKQDYYATVDDEPDYINKQSHKFFAYKSLEDTSWLQRNYGNINHSAALYRGILSDQVPTEGDVCRAPYSY